MNEKLTKFSCVLAMIFRFITVAMENQEFINRRIDQLTDRQLEFLKLFLAGESDTEIARQLFIEEPTVRKQIQQICDHLGLESGRDRRVRLKKLIAKYRPVLIPASENFLEYDIPESTNEVTESSFILEDSSDEVINRGVLPVNSSLRLHRACYTQCQEILQHPAPAFLRIRGARGFGKSTLLVWLRYWLQTEQNHVVGFVDLGSYDFDPADFDDWGQLMYQFTYVVAQSFRQAKPDLRPPDLAKFWHKDVAAASNCTEYLENYIFGKIKEPKTLIIDGIDRILGNKATQTSLLNLLRAWYELKVKAKQGNIVWANLVIADSTEPFLHYDIQDSPLQNVGNQVEISPLTKEEIGELARRYGIELNLSEIESLNQLISGHPDLVHQAIYTMKQQSWTVEQLNANALKDDGAFNYFLQKNLRKLQTHNNLKACFLDILQGKKHQDEFTKYQLELAGITKGYPFNVQVSCGLYQEFFKQYFQSDLELAHER